ncbi:MAG: hypothetical protein LVQ75_01090 [Candidatus Babeliales bacterium]
MNRKLLLLPLLLMTSLTYSAEASRHPVSAEARPKEIPDYQRDVIETLNELEIPLTDIEAKKIKGIYPKIKKGNIVIPAVAVGLLAAFFTSDDKHTTAFGLAGALSGGFIGGLYEYKRRNNAREAYKIATTETFQHKTQKACHAFLNFPKLSILSGNYTDRRALLKAVNTTSQRFILLDFVNDEHNQLIEIIQALKSQLNDTADHHTNLPRATRNTIEALNNDLERYFLKPTEANKKLLNYQE